MMQPGLSEYTSVLMEIAVLQRQLLSERLDWAQRVEKPLPQAYRTGFLGMKTVVPSAVYQRKAQLSKLNGLREKARRLASGDGGFYWWDFPWADMENCLLYDLLEENLSENWRFEHRWEKRQERNICGLFFHEEGHCSSFQGSSSVDFYEVSPYSAHERGDMMRKYDQYVQRWEDKTVIDAGQSLVRSSESGKLYASADDYLMSSEYAWEKSRRKAAYQRSLSVQHQSNTVRVSSRSLHYRSVYFAGEYQLEMDGIVTAWNLTPYALLDKTGELPKEFVTKRQQKYAPVSCAAFLSMQSDVRILPCSLLGDAFTMSLASQGDAVRYGEIITCMAEKLFFDD